jgi:cell division protein FtsI (penicillin-binding protein 3)
VKLRARPYDIGLRLKVLGAVLGLCGAVLVARAAQMQLFDRDFYQHQGNARFLREVPIATSRGMILDRNGEPLAVSTPVESVWANPKELLQAPQRLPELAVALGIPQDVLTQRIAQRADKEFVYLRRHINPDDAQAVIARGIPGVYSQREFKRFYPHGEVMAHVLGFTNIDDRGQEGLELAFDEWLTGKPGAQRVIRDRRGRIVENVDLIRAAEPGKDLTLSIDRRIQYLAYRELKAALLANQASSGSVVILDIPTGEILAMVNQPSYNPNSRGAANPGTHRNRAVTDVVEPGSVAKSFTVAAALENGVDPNIVIQTSPGTMPLAGHVIRDVHDYGPVTLERLLAKSSNIGATKLALGMDNAAFHDVLRRFGFGESTGSGFPGESAGVLPPPRGWGQLEKATISYGYGFSVTPLQIAQAYAALANDGRLLPPTFVKDARVPGRQAIDPAIARQVMHMLESVTEEGGSATRAAIKGYQVAGKTGTSRRFTVGGYEKKYISLFAGVVPTDHPRFAMVVVIQNPRGHDYYGGLVSAPVFHNVMDGALRLMDVPPDRIDEWLVATPAPATTTTAAAAPVVAEAPLAVDAQHAVDAPAPGAVSGDAGALR